MSSSSSPLTGRAPLVEFTRRFVQPPGALYLSPDDKITLRAASHLQPTTVRINAKVLTPDQGVVFWRQDLTTDLDRISVFRSDAVMEGFLLGLNVELISRPTDSRWTWASVQLAFGAFGGLGTDFHALAQGYIETDQPLIWPGGDYRRATDGRGHPIVVTGIDPAAGASGSVQCPQGARWRLMGYSQELVTDGTVANRRFELEVRDSLSATLFRAPASVVQTASLTWRYQVGPWGIDSQNLDGEVRVPFPIDFFIREQFFLATNVVNFQAGDNLGAPLVLVEEWHDE